MRQLDLSNAEELIKEWKDPEGAVSIQDMYGIIQHLLDQRAKLEAVVEAAEWHLEVSEYLNFLYDEDEYKWLPVQYYGVHTICRQAVNDLDSALRALKGEGNESD